MPEVPADASPTPDVLQAPAPAQFTGEDNRSVAERVADASLAAHVKQAMLRSDTLRAYDFEVEARGGRVAVRGSVATAQDHAIAEEVASGVAGVRAVTNQIVAPDVAPKPVIANADTVAAAMDTSLALAEADAASGTQKIAAPTPEKPKEKARQPEMHTVKSGESLWRIAQRYDVSVDDLLKMNNLSKNAKIKPGQELRVK